VTDTFPATFASLLSSARRHLVLLASLLGLAAPASAQVVIASADDECIPSPEDGIFCGEDPGGFELFAYLTQTIIGEATEPWYVSGQVGDGFSFNHFGFVTQIFDYTLTEGSRLTIAGSGNLHYRGVIHGSGALRLLAGGTLSFDPTDSLVYQRITAPYTAYYSRNTYSGGTEIAGGWLKIYDDASLGTGALSFSDGGRLQTRAAGSLRGFTLLGNDNMIQADYDLSIDGVISGDGRLNKHGAGTVTLTQTNTYAGGTHVAEGALAVSTDAHLGAADTHVSLANGTTLKLGDGFASSQRELDLQGTNAQVAVATGNATWNGATAGTGQLVKQGAGTLTLAGGIGHTGGADIAAGTLEVAVSSTLDSTGTTTWSGPITGGGNLVKSGAGTLVLSGAATHSGATVVRGGTLETAATNVLSASSALFLINGATLDLAGHDQTVGDLDSYNVATQQTESSTVVLGGATLTNLTRVINLWAGSLTGSGTVVKQGAAEMKWYAANSFSGEFRIDAGTASAHAAHVFSPNATVSLASGTTLKLNSHAQTIAGLSGSGAVALGSATLTVNQAAHTTFSGILAGTGGLTKSGSGSLTLSGDNTYSGTTTLAAGTLTVNGSLATSDLIAHRDTALRGSGTIGGLTTIADGATLAPGNSPGTLTFTNGLTLNDGSILDFELGTASDLLRITGGTLTGSASTGGITLNLADAGGFTAASYTLFDFTGASTSSFDVSDFTFGNTIAGYTYQLALVGSTLQLTATTSAVPEPSTYAAILGACAIGLALIRRRKR
jgi:fibronectin-binding autotransporter adhesin